MLPTDEPPPYQNASFSFASTPYSDSVPPLPASRASSANSQLRPQRLFPCTLCAACRCHGSRCRAVPVLCARCCRIQTCRNSADFATLLRGKWAAQTPMSPSTRSLKQALLAVWLSTWLLAWFLAWLLAASSCACRSRCSSVAAIMLAALGKLFTCYSKQLFLVGCFSWMTPNHFIKTGCFTISIH